MKRISFLMVLACLTVYCHAQYSMSGTVRDVNGEKIIGAGVVLEGTFKGTITNLEGKFDFRNLKQGFYSINVSYLGYEPQKQDISLTQDSNLEILLKPALIMADEVIVRAVRASDKEPVTASNISKSSFEHQSLGQDLPILLNFLPSVVTTSDAGAGVGYTGMRIRGTDASRTNVTINGIPLNDAESHGVFWVDIPDMAENIQNIQLQRGVGVSSNGAGAFGANLNLQTINYKSTPYAEVKSSAGSFNTYKNTIGLGTGLLNNRFSFDARVSLIKSDGFIDRASSDLKSYFISGGYYAGKNFFKINFFGGTEKTYQAWNGIPKVKLENDTAGIRQYIEDNYLSEADAKNLIKSNPRTYNPFTYDNQTDNYRQNHYQVFYSRKLGNFLSINLALHYTKGQGYYEEYKENQKFENYNLKNIIIENDTIQNTDLIRRLWLNNDFYGCTYSINYSRGKTEIILGGSSNQYYGRHYGEIIWAGFSSNGNIRYRWYNGKGIKNDFSNYIKAIHQLTDRIRLFGDFQYRIIIYNIEGTDKNLRDINQKHYFFFLNPKFGTNYNINENQNLYFSFGLSHREPTRADYVDRKPGSPEPVAEQLLNYELGYKLRLQNIYLVTNLYFMDYYNQLVLTGELNDVGDPMMENVNNSYRAGIEFEWKVNLPFKITWEGNGAISKNQIKRYTNYIGVFQDDGSIISTPEKTYSKTDIAFSPSIVSGNILTWKPTERFNISLLNKYVGKQYIDNTSSENRSLKAYSVSNMIVTWFISIPNIKEFSLNLVVNNIYNSRYVSNAWIYRYKYDDKEYISDGYFPQAGLNFLIGIKMNL